MLTREEYEEMVSHPGMFEGEAAYTPYFYTYETMQDEDLYCDGYHYYVFKINNWDISLFPELQEYEYIVLWETNDGFVHCQTATENDVQDLRDHPTGGGITIIKGIRPGERTVNELATIVAVKDPHQFPLYQCAYHVCLAVKDNGEYVTWMLEPNSGETLNGHYFNDFNQAVEDFNARA